MARKVYVDLKVRVIINADEGVDIEDVINEADFEFASQTDGADIIGSLITDWDIVDSK